MILKLKNKTMQVYRITCLIASIFMFSASVKAQIGYQVSLLNKATGEPRANVTVNANVTITDSNNGIIYTDTQRATSNDFGVLSLAVGDANTFSNFDTSKLPLYISVSVDGVMIGKSQILSVPVAEVANRLKSSFTKEDLVGTWKYVHNSSDGYSILKFNSDNTYKYDTYWYWEDGEIVNEDDFGGTFFIESNTIFFIDNGIYGYAKYINGVLYADFGTYHKQ